MNWMIIYCGVFLLSMSIVFELFWLGVFSFTCITIGFVFDYFKTKSKEKLEGWE